MSAVWLLAACAASSPEALKMAEFGPGPVVKFDVFHRPLPDVPLPNDFASRFDALSPTKKRINASIEVAPTEWEKATRAGLDELSGWGTLAPITVQFTEPLDVANVMHRHQHDLLDFSNDAVLVINVTPGSEGFCEAVPLDMGQGNYPIALPTLDLYSSDPRSSLQNLQFEEVEEDLNHNGLLDPGEDTDMDGVLDHPNTLDGKAVSDSNPVLGFYERETNTLIMKPMMPMREATTYAVVLTNRLVSEAGDPVRSPFEGINHASQTKALGKLNDCLPSYGLAMNDVQFTWSFTTQSISADYKTVRDGLYGQGALAHLHKDYPATISKLFDLKKPAPGLNSKILKATEVTDLLVALQGATGGGNSSDADALIEMQKFVDFHVIGEVQSPQFFPRTDADGAMLPFYKQVWNLNETPRSEAVQFWLIVPKNRHGPTPVAVFVHGHGGSNYAGLEVAGPLARYGVATLSINAPSHGVGLDPTTTLLVKAVFQQHNLGQFGDAILTGRAIDFNGDGQLDSGADYWTSYVFHTRDMVRQTMVDLMQVVRMVRSFDGTQRWSFDLNKDGEPDLAGDVDGDGVVDVGGPDASLNLMGGSLGGIISGVGAGVEPQFDSALAIVPGGMLSEVGARSSLGGVRNAMVLRLLAPLFTNENGVLTVSAPEAEGDEAKLPVHALPTLTPGDTVVAVNNKTNEYRCGVVQPDGKFRVAVPTDNGDPLEFRLYSGTLDPTDESMPASVRTAGCLLPDADPVLVIDSFDRDANIGVRKFANGDQLHAFTDGFGLRRAAPELRRMLGLAQIALESGDPMNWAPYWEQHRTLTYGTGETVATRVVLMPSVGDTGVPVAAGVALARAAGFVEYDRVDPRYGVSQNQLLIDKWSVEGLSRMKRYTSADGQGVLVDLEYLASMTTGNDGYDVPRLSPPLRLPKYKPGPDGVTGLMFIYLSPQGKHGFATPNPKAAFDLGSLLANMIGRYAASAGKEFGFEPCQVDDSCSWIAPIPK